MRKYGKRIAAFALSLVVALGSVCYNPPKAEAVVVESAAAMAGAFTYLSATGFEFFGEGTAYGAMADAFQMMFTDWTEEYDAYVNEVSGYPEVVAPTLQETILGGMTLLENGFVEFSAAAANALLEFGDWLVDKFNLQAGSSPISIYESDGKYCVFADGTVVPICYYKDGERPTSLPDSGFLTYGTYTLPSGMILEYTSNKFSWCKPNGYQITGTTMTDATCEGILLAEFETGQAAYVWFYKDGGSGGNLVSVMASDAYQYSDPLSMSVSLGGDYESAPIVDEQYSMVIDTGLTLEDEQSFIDAVMNGVYAGTLAPAYTIESTTAGDVVVPDEDEQENTQTGILSWTKKIWQSVQELPRTIADAVAVAVADVFVPSAEYMATVPVVITETFDNRTGFLTYPVSVLHDFAGRLSAGSQDFVLKWPTVYEPYSKGQLMAAGQFNVSEYVRDNDFASYVYGIYQWVVKAYMTFLFLGLCRKKYNSVVGDRLGG